MISRTEHPKPQFERAGYKSLNGIWQFEFDESNSGAERELFSKDAILKGEINVPFCPESKLSGIEFRDFINSVWYKRSFFLSESEILGRVFIHFGAVDYKATVYINGKLAGEHSGGYVSFSFEITSLLTTGENTITVHAEDDTRSRMIPSGKQSHRYHSKGCYYTRTTGIWQSVWLEFTPKNYVENVKFYPDPDSSQLTVIARLCGTEKFSITASLGGEVVGYASAKNSNGDLTLTISLSKTALWEPLSPRLYDLEIVFGEDKIKSYFGLRKVKLDKRRILINGKPVFQRLVLDQGFYPDGIYTAPSDEELKADIERAIAIGFNGARLHEKIFEERFLYHADRLGYLVWAEYPNLGLDPSYHDSVYPMLPEWYEEIERDFNHPSIIGWAPFNETFSFGIKPRPELIELFYKVTKSLDSTRPVIDTSGGIRTKNTDIEDTHNYEQNLKRFSSLFEKLKSDDLYYEDVESTWKNVGEKPFIVSEYGGIGFNTSNDTSISWGYGDVKTEDEFLAQAKALTDIIMDNPRINGFCYTQLTDVEQEENGLYTYDRRLKFSQEKLREIFGRKAAIEEI